MSNHKGEVSYRIPLYNCKNMKNKWFVLLVSIFSLFSCGDGYDSYKNVHTFDFDDFVKTETLHGNVLNFDSLVMMPTEVHVLDSILLVVEAMDDKLIHLYNLNTRKHIGARISRGQGPQDMILPVIISMNENTLYIADMMLSVLRKYDMKDFLNHDSPTFLSEVKFEDRIYIDAALMKDKVWGYLYTDNCILSEFNLLDGKRLKGGMHYPETTIQYTDAERRDAFYMSVASDDKERLVIAYSLTDLLDFYDTNGSLLKRLHGPEQFYSYTKEYHDGNVVTTKLDGERNREAYFSPCWVNDGLFVLYDGEHLNAPNHDSNSGWIFSFSNDGIPKTAYQLDVPLFRCCVDSKSRKIYGISINPEYQIVEYSY